MMYYIAHRGLLDGPNEKWENAPWIIDEAILYCGHAEVDLWVVDNIFYLGHDVAKYKVDWQWLFDRRDNLFIHCKNIAALCVMSNYRDFYHYFWHQQDTLTLTSRGMIWAFPGKQPIRGSIAVLPERHNDDISQCIGICTDFVRRYKENK